MSNKIYKKSKAYSNKLLLCTLLLPFLVSCGHTLVGYGHIKIVDPSCQPIKYKRINVNNIKSSVFLNSGHLTKDVYTTDKQGQFEFDIEKNSDKLFIFLSDENGEKEGASSWNWYTATSSNDKLLLSGSSSRVSKFKTELLKSSVKDPIVFVYPYKNDVCENNNPELDKYNVLKRNAEEKARVAAKKAAEVTAEKARIDAIKVVIPKFKIEAYGAVRSFYGEERIEYEIPENSNLITNESLIRDENQMTGGTFGIIYSMSEFPVFKKASDFTVTLSSPDDGIINLSTGKSVEGRLDSQYYINNTGSVMLMHIQDDWQLAPGKWQFQIKHKDSILLEHAFIVE